ncbi:MAG: hypothetical protein K2M82_05065, partial [Lachnospiraceae bacterium]|nr:hypothetical protein [Lachnospiraceae bacterium]
IFDNPARREDVFTIVNENIDHRIFLNSPYTDINNTNDSSLINCFYDNTHKISSVAGVESYTQSIYFGNEDDNDVFLYWDYWDSFEGSITDILLSDAFECVSTMSSYGYDEGYYEQYRSFIDCESSYRKFVVENYTDYPDIIDEIFPQSLDCEKVLSSLLDRFSTEYISTNPVEDYYSYVVNGVREYLHENAEYTLTPGKAPYGEDFVEYFLNQNHKGYCVHFATAGALMLRKAGIPARYVEGYYVSGSELQSQYGEEYTNVTDSRAHAWVEVYYPLKGWQVVEFTPSYGEYGEVPDENDDWEDLEESDTASENDTESEIPTDSETQTENDDTDTQSGDSENDTESNTLQADLISDSDNSIANDVFSNSGYASNIITVLCCVVGVVLLWLLARVIYRKILLKIFERKERRKGAAALYKYALRLLSFGGFFVEQNESEQTFARRVTRQCEFLSDKSFIKFTENALKSRFGREVPSRKNIAEMIKFTDKLSNDIYTNSRRAKKMIMKYFLFLH